MKNGFGKKTKVSEFHVQKRGGSGIKAAKITPKTGEIAGVKLVDTRPVEAGEKEEIEGGEEDKKPTDAVVISMKGQIIRLPIKSIKTLGRATQGVTLMRMKSGDKVAAVTFI